MIRVSFLLSYIYALRIRRILSLLPLFRWTEPSTIQAHILITYLFTFTKSLVLTTLLFGGFQSSQRLFVVTQPYLVYSLVLYSLVPCGFTSHFITLGLSQFAQVAVKFTRGAIWTHRVAILSFWTFISI